MFTKTLLKLFSAAAGGALFSLFLLGFHHVNEPAVLHDYGYYEKGIEEVQKGNFEKALEVWGEARSGLESADFKIGQSFIELVAEKELTEYYEEASNMYMWGLESNDIEANRKQLFEEVELLESVLNLKRYKTLKNKVEDSDRSVFKDLKAFWKEQDPTPFTAYNERLIEHWNRVAYAKEHYSKPGSEKLDDRGRLYIRYGAPYVQRQNQFNYNSGIVNYLLDQRMADQLDPVSNGESFFSSAMKTLQFNLESRIRTLHKYPNYEVWTYNQLNNESESTVFLFGSEDGQYFKEKQTVEDYIPNSAFREHNPSKQSLVALQQSMQARNNNSQDNSSIGNLSLEGNQRAAKVPDVRITPALILQIMYYRQLAPIDSYFGDAFEKMINQYLSQTKFITSSLAREFEYVNRGDIVRLQRSVPRNKSKILDEMPSIEVKGYDYRFLDEEGDTYRKVFVLNDYEEAAKFNYIKSYNRADLQLHRYKLKTGIQLFDENYELKHQQLQSISLNNETKGEMSSTFDLKENLEELKGRQIKIASELKNINGSNGSSKDKRKIFGDSLAGIGRVNLEASGALSSGRLALSDIVMGYGNTPRNGQEWLSFRIAHEYKIPQGKSVQLYYEVYNLGKNSSDLANFTFEYKIRSVRKGVFKSLLGEKEDEKRQSITVTHETDQNRFSQSLEIQAASLDKGKYELIVTVNDRESGEQIQRVVEFEVI